MVESGNAENKIEGMIFNGEGVGRTYLKFNFIGQPFLLCIASRNFDHDRREINTFESDPRNGLRQKNGEGSRTCSHINGPSLLNPLGQYPFENPLAREPPISLGHKVEIFRHLLIFNNSGLCDSLFHCTKNLPKRSTIPTRSP